MVPKITHVIFDLDGLLLDSEETYTRVNSEILAHYGKTYTMQLKAKTMGMKMDEAIHAVLENEGLEGRVTVKQYMKQYKTLLGEYLPLTSLLPGALRLVRHLTAHKIPLAICTGSDTYEFHMKMKNQKELLDLVPLRVLTGDDPAVKKGKPEPDGFLVTMERFEKKPQSAANILVFEDSLNGVLAAVAAGMHVIMVPDSRYCLPPEDVRDKICLVLESLEDFKPEMMGLPPYD